MIEYGIYYADTEYARNNGDPLLGTVMAKSKDEAEELARAGQWYREVSTVINTVCGLWACELARTPTDVVKASKFPTRQ